ncbi:hypothetical protein HDU77_011573 [Chytriomyces hyalinus]|nr:hypothetical protein HDU77_011573 [Chytriomyces hyalinus]
MNCNEDVIFLLFKECDPTSVLPMSTVCKQYRKVFLARRSIICQYHVEHRITSSFSAKSKDQQKNELQQLLQRKVGWHECKEQIITLNQDYVKPRSEDAYEIFLDFGRWRWWQRLESYQLYYAVKDRLSICERYEISPQTVDYIFKLYNGATYRAETRCEMIFGIIFGPKVGADDAARLKWLQENFGKEFPKQDLIFLNPSNETLEYRRSKHDRVNVGVDAGSSGNGGVSSSEPRFSEYFQIPLDMAIARALRGMSADPDSKSDAGMALYPYLNRFPTDHEESVIWHRCVGYFR